MGLCAPFWWHGNDELGRYRVLHNGTLCFINTGTRYIAVTADHVYQQYLVDRDRFDLLVCQFGGAVVDPERQLIDRSASADLATFEASEVLVASTGSSVHHALQWPPPMLGTRDVVLYGGFPGLLRQEFEKTTDFPFQTFATAITESSTSNIVLHVDLPNLHWPSHPNEAINPNLGGQSGGPVFRIVEGDPIDRLEVAGFIYEYNENLDVMFAKHAHRIGPDGGII